MTQEYVDYDSIKLLLTQYSNWLSITAITKYFDEDLKSNSTIFLNSSTLKNYLSKVIIMLKDKFTKYCDWEESQCTKMMSREEFENKCKREQGRVNVDVSEDTKRVIYSKASPWLN